MRKSSPVYPKYEPSDYGGVFEYDPEVDFSEFLNEARRHKIESNLGAASPRLETSGRRLDTEKKGKKWWKSSLLSWLKSEKKGKPGSEPAKGTFRSIPRKKHVSGPVFSNSNNSEIPGWRPTSGPLAGLFKPKKADADVTTPYMTLHESNKPRGSKPYGPVYLVT